jgi:hypothetical protein
MSVAQTIQSFAGIANENEFYGHHYLAEVFKGDIRSLIEKWQAAEEAATSEEEKAAARSPQRKLSGLGGKWFAGLAAHARTREDADRLQSHADLHAPLLAALGYTLKPSQVELVPGMPVPVWSVLGEAQQAPRLLIVPAYEPGSEEETVLDQKLKPLHYGGLEVPKALHHLPWLDIVSETLFGADHPPRFIILAGLTEWLLLDRYKWPNNRLLRFDWTEILDRKDAYTLQAAAALLHRDSLAPDQGASLLEGLDENAHKHAFGVSEDLKYALRSAIELLGNEAVRQLDAKAAKLRKSIYSGVREVDPGELSLECLRLVYRLMFLFYIEARPELGYVPIQKSEVYAKGYSLESLRDLELVQLTSTTSRNGTFFDATLRRLFSLISQGCGSSSERSLGAASEKEAFSLAPLDSKLFDPLSTPLLNQVTFPNHIWQQVIKGMSLSQGKRKGRVSYQLLSINQLGAVYEALLSYRGFFAPEDLCEVQPEPKKKTKSSEEEDEEDQTDPSDQTDADDEACASSGDVMDSAWFVPASRIDQYKVSERVHDKDDLGRLTLRKYPRDTFIYRLAGRDRQKSASYYTPQVLTRCLVKYALKELLAGKTADEILRLTICEPAMGSAAFINEAVNQLAEAYLERKQAELKKRIPHDLYATELQKVRMFIADRNAFGVDLNPIATELAEVSLWLNAIYGEPAEPGKPPKAARVPWFGYQLFTGNSLIGCRREVYPAATLREKKKELRWHNLAPKRLDPQNPARGKNEIYHFLLPDEGMAKYKDASAKALYPQDFERLKAWRTKFTAPLDSHEIQRLLQLSTAIDALWAEHAKLMAEDRQKTEDPLGLWPHTGTAETRLSRAEKEEIRTKHLLNRDDDLATPYRRLKLVMDYWCALWFWPITQSATLPSREQWWMEIGAILEGNIVDVTIQHDLDLTAAPAPVSGEKNQPHLIDAPSAQPELSLSSSSFIPHPSSLSLRDKYGQLRISRLRQHFPRIATVEAASARLRFFHWELAFADVFASRGGFDLVLGNPPWLKIEWNEAGILGEVNPLFAIRKLNSSEISKLRADAFARFPGLQEAWTDELEEAEATQNFLNATQNYPLLKGMQTNLYKCFLPLGWKLNGKAGVSGFLHPEGPYDDPKGGGLREVLYRRLRSHFQFQNQLILFPIAHRAKYSINIYAPPSDTVRFKFMANLFHPSTIESSFTHDGQGPVGGLKNSSQKWEVGGHASRVIEVDEELLAAFAQLFDQEGTPALRARLPVVHAKQISEVLRKLAAYSHRLAKIQDDYFCLEMWHETYATSDGTIIRNPDRSAPFASSTNDWLLSGPHFDVGLPFAKTPRAICSEKGHYDNIDLELLPESFLPRSNYTPMADSAEYLLRTPAVSWSEPELREVQWENLTEQEKQDNISLQGQAVMVQRWRHRHVTEYYRLIHRRRLSQGRERTLIPSIIPPAAGHVHTCISTSFKTLTRMIEACVSMTAMTFDFFVKSTGQADFTSGSMAYVPLASKKSAARKTPPSPSPCPTAWEKSRARSKAGKNSASSRNPATSPTAPSLPPPSSTTPSPAAPGRWSGGMRLRLRWQAGRRTTGLRGSTLEG